MTGVVWEPPEIEPTLTGYIGFADDAYPGKIPFEVGPQLKPVRGIGEPKLP